MDQVTYIINKMNNHLLKIPYLLKLLVFWLFYFAFFRVLFITYHHAQIPDGNHSETVLAFLFALRLDVSVASSIMLIPFVLWIVQQYNKNRTIHLINLWYHYIVVFLISVLSTINIKLYGEMNELLTYKTLNHLLFPDGPLNYVSLWSNLLLFIGSAVFAYVGIRIYRKYIISFSYPIENKKLRLVNITISAVLFVVLLRGGVQSKMINATSSQYSDISINNQIATNNIWFFMNSLAQ